MLTVFLTLCGLYVLATGRVPVFLGGRRSGGADGSNARLIGLVLALGFPLSLLLARVLPLVFPEGTVVIGSAVEIAVALLVIGAAFAVGRLHRAPASGA